MSQTGEPVIASATGHWDTSFTNSQIIFRKSKNGLFLKTDGYDGLRLSF
jgi:hypothetical protein